jgi:hypothetical protein
VFVGILIAVFACGHTGWGYGDGGGTPSPGRG